MLRILFSTSLLLLIGCNVQQDQQGQEIEQEEKGWQKPKLEGHWEFVSVVEAEDTPFLRHYPEANVPAKEALDPEPPYHGPDLIFDQDSVYELFYPRRVSYQWKYAVDSGYLHFGHKWFENTFPVEYTNDTLFIYKPVFGNKYNKEGYIKTQFNDSIVNILMTQKVNYPELAGTWHLIRFDSFDDGSEGYELDFPHELQDSIVITREELIKGMEEGMTLWISTDGEKRDYTFFSRWGYLYLTAGDWFKGDDPGVHYRSW